MALSSTIILHTFTYFHKVIMNIVNGLYSRNPLCSFFFKCIHENAKISFKISIAAEANNRIKEIY